MTEETQIMTKTSRTCGAVGSNAKVPKYVRKYSTKDETILDFGSGKEAIHANSLLEEGFVVYAHEIGQNYNSNFHDPYALKRKYDMVYASNVLNVQPSETTLHNTLNTIISVMKPKSKLIANFPKEPRKNNLSSKKLYDLLRNKLNFVYYLEKNQSPVFLCYN